MPVKKQVNHKRAAMALTASSFFAVGLVYRGWHYFEWGRRGPKDWFYMWITATFVLAVVGAVTHFIASRRKLPPEQAA